MSDIIISIETIKDNFNSELQQEGNSKIFFSGKFGMGKTYFLKDFFESKKEEYEVFHLYPVNYQILQNDDILDLIKYDILIELIKKDNAIFKENTVEGIRDNFLLFFSWFKNKFSVNSLLKGSLDATDTILGLTSMPFFKLGRPLKDLLDLDKDFQEFKKDYLKGEKGIINNYIDELKDKDIKEVDYTSYLIKKKIIELKNNKKSVLIIDDLDRIDPDNIFRVLNVFSAYFEREDENKFGFDFIIIVADYKNLKNIFQHKYGKGVDFNGYIDKFFSINPYNFNNKKAIINVVDNIAKNIRSEEENLSEAMSENGYIVIFLRYIFLKTIEGNLINLRNLLKATKFQFSELKKGSYNKASYGGSSAVFNKAIKVIIKTFSDEEKFIEILESIKEIKTSEHVRRVTSFDLYIKIMIDLALGINLEDKKEEFVTWLNYEFRQSASYYGGIEEKNNKKEELFIDLLIIYIKQGKYLDDGHRNYRY